MKKVFAVILSEVLLLTTLTACGGKRGRSENEKRGVRLC